MLMMEQLSLFGQSDCSSDNIPCEKPNVWKLYTDGASRCNPGPSGIGFSLLNGDTVVCEQGFYIGNRTNNQAEYTALLVGIFYAKEFMKPSDKLTVFSDSQLLIRQMNRQYRVRDTELQKLQAIAFDLLSGYQSSFSHIYREQNGRADELANRGVDKKIPLPKNFVDMFSRYT